MAKRKRIITAGRLVTGVVYTVSSVRDTPQERAAKTEISSAARERANLRTSWQKLEVVLAANFSMRDLHVVLTYDDEHLPPTRPEAVKCLKKWITQLRSYRKARGEELRYVYVTEQLSAEGGRLHHHIVINGTGQDYDVIRSLWVYGADIDIEPLDAWAGYDAIAQYLTKEPKECGRVEVGARNWTPSIGLKRPERQPDTGMVPDNMTITAPPGAIILDRDEKRNGFGEYHYLKYLLPERREEEKKHRPPRKRQPNSTSYIFQA